MGEALYNLKVGKKLSNTTLKVESMKKILLQGSLKYFQGREKKVKWKNDKTVLNYIIHADDMAKRILEKSSLPSL